MKEIFISYSYDSQEHEDWVKELAIKLEEFADFNVKFDKFDLTVYSEKNKYMEDGVFNSDTIIVIASENYVKKANERTAGVGIETSMIAARHWEEISKTNKSKIIVLLRSNKSQQLPNYLTSKIRLNFDSAKYDIKFKELLKYLKEEPLVERPPKKKVINDEFLQITKSLTKTEDILSINYKNRNQIDSNTKYKTKYEYWECLNPSKQYFLILFPSSVLKETIKAFLLKNKKLPREITILKEKSSKTITELILEHDDNVSVNEFSYSQFIWDYCIDMDIKKQNKDNIVEPYYIDQNMYSYYSNEKEEKSDNVINEFIQNDSNQPIMMILAQAGSGKTTLCEKIISKIDNVNEKVCIFVSSEEFKEHFSSKDIFNQSEINTVYDLYDTYKKIDRKAYMSENIFNLGLFNGNIVVLIDGLDEIMSLYQEKFNLTNFFKSLIELNQQLGKCKIIISSREYYWKNNNILEREDILLMRLKGFDEKILNNYLENRFKNHTKSEKSIQSSKKYLLETMELSNENRIMPFLVDMICKAVEEQLEFDLDKLEFNNTTDSYPNNNEVIDNVIYSILNRELIRQTYPDEIKVKDLIKIFKDLTINYGETFSHENLDYIIQLNYPSDEYLQISKSIKFTHLLEVENNYIKFKYDILENYFLCLYLMDLFSSYETINSCSPKHICKLQKSSSPIFKDIKKFFQNQRIEIFIENTKKIIACLINLYKDLTVDKFLEKYQIEQSISAILYLLIEIKGKDLSKDKKIDLIKQVYNANNNKLEFLFIIGDFFELDFSNLEIWNSKFQNYQLFLKSKFDNTSFYYCTFKDIFLNTNTSTNIEYIQKINFDSCELNELNNIFDNESNIENIEKNLFNIFKKMIHNNKIVTLKVQSDDQYFNYYDCLLNANFLVELDENNKKMRAFQIEKTKIKDIRNFIKSGNKNRSIKQIIENIRTTID